ncbi:MAG: M12 family metallopeptidase [Pseudomonadota bacterium]
MENGVATYQGDIVLGTSGVPDLREPEPHPTRRDFSRFGRIAATPGGVGSSVGPLVSRISDGVINRNWLWKDGIIPYSIEDGDFSTTELETIQAAIEELNSRTNLNITPKWTVQNHVHFIKDADMIAAGTSKVGRGRIYQRIRLNDNVGADTIIHELLHAAGFWHEQSRADRDEYIEIKWENIIDGKESNFDKHVSDGRQVTPYDRNSIMHYSGYAFSKNDEPTIVDATTGEPVVRPGGLSPYDIDGINSLYPVDVYAGRISRPMTSLRVINVTVTRVQSDDRDGGAKDEIDFYMKSEMGPGWDWRPGVASNPTEKLKSGTVERRGNDITPNWEFKNLVPIGEPFAKIWLKLRDDDGRSGTEGGISPDETIDINPFPNAKAIELYVDTAGGDIYLADERGARRDENYIGSLGEDIELEGFESGIKAYVRFMVTVTDPT